MATYTDYDFYPPPQKNELYIPLLYSTFKHHNF